MAATAPRRDDQGGNNNGNNGNRNEQDHDNDLWNVRRRMVDDLLAELRERAPATSRCDHDHDARDVRLVETHISWVLLGRDEAYKIKKPVTLPFLDFSSFEARENACRTEVRINRRLAPRTYLGVVPIRRRAADGRFTFGAKNGGGAIVDWAVRMVRLDETHRADALLERNELTRAHVDALANSLAAFHADSPSSPRIARFGAPEVVQRNVVDNFTVLAGCGGGGGGGGDDDDNNTLISNDAMAEIERWQGAFLRGHRDLLEQRMVNGDVREGHGDLRLEHVFYREGMADDFEVIDGIEFDERYRIADVCADVAFFAMDLARLGRVDLAERFIAVYARAANDFELYRLIDFYESYRACVRAKIAAMAAFADRFAPDDVASAARAEARRYLILAQSARRRSVLQPVLVAVAGSIATGKSSLSHRLAEELSAPIVDADRTRKHMIGMRPTEHVVVATADGNNDGAWKGPYDPSFSAEVYAEVLRRADAVLASGRPVIVDASFRTEKARAAVRELASKHNVPFRLVECVAPVELCRERLAARDPATSVSDATLDVLDSFVARYEPIRELPPTEHLRIDTSGSVETALAQVERDIDTWPAGLVR